MTSETARLDKVHSPVRAPSGSASYADTGGPGRPVRSVHGIGSGSDLRRHRHTPV
jgi:hypothetical protein